MMRLRLSIYRNELPVVNTLWPVPDTNFKHTIFQLLEQVTTVFPLESGTWGLEHYLVTVGGFECLHYHLVGDVCKDEDEVVIRPLQYAEVRSRTLLGRDQISHDGRHLVDGIPLGRPKLKGVTRPEVWIPPMKRAKVDDEPPPSIQMGWEAFAAKTATAGHGKLVRVEDEGEELCSDDEEDVDFEDDESELSSDEESSEDASDESEDDEDSEDASSSLESDWDEDESMSDQPWEGIEEKPPNSPSKNSANEIELASPTDDSNSRYQSMAHSQSGITSAIMSNSLKRKTRADNPQQLANHGSVKKLKVVGIPGEGMDSTKQRNSRRRDSKQLRYLKEVGELPRNATLATLREWKNNQNGRSSHLSGTTAGSSVSQYWTAERLGNPGEAAATAENDTSPEPSGGAPREEDAEVEAAAARRPTVLESAGEAELEHALLEEQRQKLLRDIRSGGVDITDDENRSSLQQTTVDDEDKDEAPEEMSTKASVLSNGGEAINFSEPAAAMTKAPAKKTTKLTDMIPSSVARRSTLKTSPAARMLLGSLGLKVPKTPDERAALQDSMAERAQQRNSPQVNGRAVKLLDEDEVEEGVDVTGQADEDDDSWHEKLDLSAVECCDGDITLSEPPFPFYQRWDPQQRRKKSKSRAGAQYMASNKRSKNTAAEGEYVESYDKYNTNGMGDALDYDDVQDEDEYWEEGALLDDDYGEESDDPASQQLQAEAAKGIPADDGFPALPDNLSDLPVLAEADAQKDDFITFEELTCSAATGWQPTMLTRTARLQDKGEVGWTIQLALRDVAPKEYDDEGNRVYRKFEMEGVSDDEDNDARERAMEWDELIDPRLLLRPWKSSSVA